MREIDSKIRILYYKPLLKVLQHNIENGERENVKNKRRMEEKLCGTMFFF